ncbi:MAG TPA: hypothetical protein VML01_12530 [Bryobacterales bacterium]|nr:hypothetical protein [Bryobacterales bacterium]
MTRLLALVLLSLPGLQGQAGVEVLTPRFRVMTLLPAESAQQAAQHLETAHASLQAIGIAPRPVGHEPIPVLLLPTVDDLETLFASPIVDGGFARGLFQPGEDRPYIVLAWDPPETARIALAHEYVHWIFKDPSQPLWYREGLAEYLSRSRLTPTGAVFGSPSPRFLEPLQSEPWLPLSKLLAARRKRDLITSRTFYGQCWLIAYWLASQSEPRKVPRYESFLDRVENEGEAAVETRLREHLAALLSGKPSTTAVTFAPPDPAAFSQRVLDEWEWPFYLADAWRERSSWDKAAPELQRLGREFPSRPEPRESLGALQMDRGDYEAAEPTLAEAIAKGSLNPRTHHRYSLLLLRPVEGGAAWARRRAAMSRDQARKALDLQPGEPAYILTEAQALGLLDEWPEAAERLSELASYPEWRERAEKEFDVLLHRRRQYAAKLSRPRLDAPEAARFNLAALAEVPPPIAAPLPPPKEPEVWPPPGTILLYGHIVKIECLGTEKIITVRTPQWRVQLRERADAPAKLLSPPRNMRTLPCEAKGWEVNVVYRPDLKARDVRGELVAVVF